MDYGHGGPIGTHQLSVKLYNPNPLHNVHIGSPSPGFGVRNTHPKFQSLFAIISRAGKVADIEFGPYSRSLHSQGPFEQKPIKNFGEKGAWASLRNKSCRIL